MHAAAFATPRTSPYEASASGESCPNSTQVGVLTVQTGAATRNFGLFNLVPPFGAAAAIGASPFGTPLVFAVHLREPDNLALDLAGFPRRSTCAGSTSRSGERPGKETPVRPATRSTSLATTRCAATASTR